MNQIDPNFDWVTARTECTPATVLAALRAQCKADVDKRNSLLSSAELQDGITFQVVIGAKGFRVDRTDFTEQPIDFALFSQTSEGISVSYKDQKATYSGALTLSNEGECKLRIAPGQELSFWQFRKHVLEQLFFSGEALPK